MREMRSLSSQPASYMSETDYFEPDWQRAFWGVHYDALMKVKNCYDRTGLFSIHHGVGSDVPRANAAAELLRRPGSNQ